MKTLEVSNQASALKENFYSREIFRIFSAHDCIGKNPQMGT